MTNSLAEGRGIVLANIDDLYLSNANMTMFGTNSIGLELSSVTAGEIENFGIYGADVGVKMYADSDLFIHDASIQNSLYGIRVNNISSVVFRNIQINNAQKDAIEGSESSHLDFHEIQIVNTGEAAVRFSDSSSLIFNHCLVGTDELMDYPNRYGFRFYRTNDVGIYYCTVVASVDPSDGHGIYIGQGSFDIDVAGNIISDNEGFGVAISWASDNYIVDNEITYNGAGGIYQGTPYNERNQFSANVIINEDGIKAIDDDDCSNAKVLPPLYFAPHSIFSPTIITSCEECNPGDTFEVFRSDANCNALELLQTVQVENDGTLNYWHRTEPGIQYLAVTVTDASDAHSLGMTTEHICTSADFTLPEKLPAITKTEMTSQGLNVGLYFENRTNEDFSHPFAAAFCFRSESGKEPVGDLWYPAEYPASIVQTEMAEVGVGGNYCSHVDVKLPFDNQVIPPGGTYPSGNESGGTHVIQFTIRNADYSLFTPDYIYFDMSSQFEQNIAVPVVDRWSVEDEHLAGYYRKWLHPPLVDAGPDFSVESNTPVTLDGSNSYGYDGPLTCKWFKDDKILGSGEIITVSLPDGVHFITLTCTAAAETRSDDVVVAVGSSILFEISNNPVPSGQPAKMVYDLPQSLEGQTVDVVVHREASWGDIVQSFPAATTHFEQNVWSWTKSALGTHSGPYQLDLVVGGKVLSSTSISFAD